MINTIGQRQAEQALQLGKIFSPEQALKIKLVDELCESNLLMSEAEARMKEWCKIPSQPNVYHYCFIIKIINNLIAIARQLTKESMRFGTLNKLVSERDSDLKLFINNTIDPILQTNLDLYMKSLRKKQKKYYFETSNDQNFILRLKIDFFFQKNFYLILFLLKKALISLYL